VQGGGGNQRRVGVGHPERTGERLRIVAQAAEVGPRLLIFVVGGAERPVQRLAIGLVQFSGFVTFRGKGRVRSWA
jgi:hypothetical protein